MLNSLRNSASGLAAKVLLVLLVLTFAVWGIGDIIRNPSKRLTIATVGDEKVTAEEFVRAFNREAEILKRNLRDSFNQDMLKDSAFSHHVLFQLINSKLLNLESEALGLVPSDKDVVRRIRSSPNFHDEKGNFDKVLFEATLKNSNTTEKNFVDKLRQDMASQLLVDTLSLKSPVLDSTARAIYDSSEESREITLYALKPSMVTSIPAPDDGKLKAYYEAHQKEFTAPELRSVSYITISSANVSKDTKVSEDELKAAYNERKDDFKKPEMRLVEQLLYSSEETAKKAKALLVAGKNFEQVAQETNALNKNALTLGKVERKNIFENAADTVFTLEKDKSTDPIQSPFGWHIFRVSNIFPPSVSTFEEVRPALVKELSLHVGDKALNDLTNKFQDSLAGGNTLAEAARDNNLKVISVGPFDASGLSADNTKLTDIPILDKFLEVSFKTDEKGESPLITSKGGTYYIVHVDKITPERLRSLDEVKGLVTLGWQKEQRDLKLDSIAREIGTKFISANDRKALIEKYKLQPIKTASIKRNAHTAGDISLPNELVKDVFGRNAHEGTNTHLTKNDGYFLAVVNSIIPASAPESDPKLGVTLNAINKWLDDQQKNEILQQYAQFLSKKYVVSIDQQALQAVLK